MNQTALAAAWPRFAYLGNAAAELRRRGQRVPPAVAATASRDVTATLMQVLGRRLRLREARLRERERPAADLAPELAPVAGCEVDPMGGERAGRDELAHTPEPMFEDRKVNGWII